MLISGFTVMIAMAGMYLAGAATFQSFATGTIIVVAVAMVGSLTVLPAVLAWLGDRVEKGHVPFIGRIKRRTAGAGIWARIVDRVLRHPVISAAAATALLLFMAIPALGLHTAVSGVETLPQNLGVIKTYNRIQEAFPGGPIPAQVVVSAEDVSRRRGREGDRRAGAAGRRRPAVRATDHHRRQSRQHRRRGGHPGGRRRHRLGLEPRPDRAALQPDPGDDRAGCPGPTADVTGYTAQSRDFNDTMKSHAPLVFAFVLSAAFLLLLVTFRSIVIPLKAILLNLLSVAAAYGVVVWIFQEGHLESLLGFESNGAITSWLPLFLFVVLFGLSMDYHVFILTRVREGYDRGRSTGDAVAHAIKTTAGVVTSAAVVMVAVFAIFATLSLLEFKEMGVGPGDGGADRRDDHPRRAAAGDDEAARRLELVPAELARVAPPGLPREPRRPAPGPREGSTGGAAPRARARLSPIASRRRPPGTEAGPPWCHGWDPPLPALHGGCSGMGASHP